jgi:hypothetical protein
MAMKPDYIWDNDEYYDEDRDPAPVDPDDEEDDDDDDWRNLQSDF